ncbi:PREDICTED: Werner Syndrome-like exonuclease [Nicotiana attenuata]|uniref:Werner syndrome-like exonuclease n=1 Tax=Nicotiana attenuata TaxID=49451 RepID=A0A1J6JY65_NICAT|nr:PREDICTED: Werner Syndrome-like exonuclease [Nicotiana attenuata]OIT22709.1 werner syndrome-like exonuclease [Nicotiana attenuata]
MTTFRIVDNEEQDNRYDLFDVYFHSDTIKTTVTSDPEIVTQWISETESSLHDRRHLIVGLDVEWRPSFHRNQQFKVATLQLCVDRRCLIFQLLYCSSIPDSLVSFLSNGDYTFVGVGVENDVEKLVEDHDLSVSNMVDLRALAADAYEMSNLKTAGLKELCNVVLGREIEKPRHITMGRWDSEWLSLDQIKYACVDAFVSFEIAKHLNVAAAAP